jgi:hypothetical protein
MEDFSGSWWAFGLFLILAGAAVFGIWRTRGKKPTGVKNVVEFPGEKE